MLCTASIVMVGCSDNSSKKEELNGSNALKFAQDACNREDYNYAHQCVAVAKESYGHDAYLFHHYADVALLVYGEEMKFVLTNNLDNPMARVKMMLADLTPRTAKPIVGANWYDCELYLEEVQLYNTFLSKIVDYLLAVDLEEEAKSIAGRGLEVPVEINFFLGSFDKSDAKAIAAKVK